jgi:hypothetical protein
MRTRYVVFAFGLAACGADVTHASSTGRSDASAPRPDAASLPDAAAGRDGTVEAAACTFTGFGGATAYGAALVASSLFAYSPAGGVPNLIVVESPDPATTFQLFANRGDGTFARAAFQGALTYFGNAVSADFDGDGFADIASSIGDTTTDGGAEGMLQIDKNIGGRAFASQLATYPTPQASGSLAVGDFDRDGHPDIAMAGVTSVPRFEGISVLAQGLDVFFNDGHGSFRSPVVYKESGSGLAQIAAADFDGDGAPDLALFPGGIFLNAGDGTFGAELPLPALPDDAGALTLQVWAVGDFNGDGKADLVATGLTNEIEVFLSVGAGMFAAPVTVATGSTPSVVAVGDFNGDSRPDVVVLLDSVAESASIGLHLNQGDGTFSPETNLVQVPFAYVIDTADFNGDGVTDLAVTNYGFTESDGGVVENTVAIALSQCR